MSREQLIISEPHEISNSYNDESLNHHPGAHKTPAEDALSQASRYSIIDLDHDTLIERANQLASMLDKSARELRTYTQLAREYDGLSVTKKKYAIFFPDYNVIPD